MHMSLPLSVPAPAWPDAAATPSRLALRADRDVIVLVSNCPQINNPCNGFDPTAVELEISEAAA